MKNTWRRVLGGAAVCGLLAAPAQAQSPAVPPPAKNGAMPAVAAPLPATIPGALPAAPPPGMPPAAPSPAAAPPTLAPPPPYRSMLFTAVETEQVAHAVQTYLLNLEKARELALKQKQMEAEANAAAKNETKPEPRKTQIVEYPQFHLALIAYNGPANWTIWMNRHKYTPEELTSGEVTVLSVSGTHARFLWTPRNFQRYESRLPAEDTANVKIRRDDKAVAFTLAPGQSFSSYAMRVQEGYLPPRRMETVLSAPAAPALAPVAQASPPAATVPLPQAP